MPENQTRHRIGVFGGSFDPIHTGHLIIGEQAREQLALDELRFMPAAVSPFKTEQKPSATSQQRLHMVQLAILGNPMFTVDPREIERGGTSYTVDTLAELGQSLADSELFFIMGADSLTDFSDWREPARICELAFVAVLARGGHPPPDMSLLAKHLPPQQTVPLESHLLAVPEIEISSTDLRRRLAEGRSTRYQLPAAVEAYIATNGLYR